MATKYEKQIEKLLGHVKQLHQLIEERTQQLKYWQGYANKLREERQRLSSGLLAAARKTLTEVANRYQALKAENGKLRKHIEHLNQLQQKQEFQLKTQLQYALGRIDDLSIERKHWRTTVQHKQQQIWKAQEQLQEAEKRFAAELQALQEQLDQEQARNKTLSDRLETAERQIEMQQVQWQDLLAEKQALMEKLSETESALAIAQKTLSETLASQQSSVGREVDALRQMVVSLQRQTEALQAELAENQATIDKQERFIAVLKADGSKPNIRSISEKKPNGQNQPPTAPPKSEDTASG